VFSPPTPNPAPQGGGESVGAQIRIERLAFVQLYAERVQHHADLGVLAGGEDGVPPSPRLRRTSHAFALTHLSAEALAKADAPAQADAHVLRPFIAGAAEIAGAQDDDLPPTLKLRRTSAPVRRSSQSEGGLRRMCVPHARNAVSAAGECASVRKMLSGGVPG
jgi:hypothetical protein